MRQVLFVWLVLLVLRGRCKSLRAHRAEGSPLSLLRGVRRCTLLLSRTGGMRLCAARPAGMAPVEEGTLLVELKVRLRVKTHTCTHRQTDTHTHTHVAS